jgi:hypothetical protein
MATKSKKSVAKSTPVAVTKTKAAKPVKVTAAEAVKAPVVAKSVAKEVLKQTTAPAAVKGATAAPVVGQAKFADTARITLVNPNNPRKDVEGKGGGEFDTPFKRYAVIMQVANSKDNTVAAFLKVLPKWRATLNRAVKEGHIQIATLTAAVLVGGMMYNVPVIG